MALAFHGIGAYRGGSNPLALRNNLNTAMSGVEICAADRPIRAFGMIADFNVTAAHSDDVWSEVSEDGVRYTNGSVEYLTQNEVLAVGARSVIEYADFTNIIGIRNPSQTIIDYLSDLARREGSHEYIELFVRAKSLKALWVKDWASAATKRAAAILAANRGVPLIVVDGTDRIHDVAEKHGLNQQPTPGNENFKTPTLGDLLSA